MASYIDQHSSLLAQLERVGRDTAILKSHKAPMLPASIDSSCFLESTASALRTKGPAELIWEFVTTTPIDKYNAQKMLGSPSSSGLPAGRGTKMKKNKFRSVENVDINLLDHRTLDNSDDDESDLEKTVRTLSVSLSNSK